MKHVLILCFALILTAPAQARNSVLDIRAVTSPNGIEAWLVEDHSIPVISLKFAFKNAGTALDPKDKQGLSRMLSNTLDEGAGELDSQTFQKELQDLSITLNFGSGRDHFMGNLKTLSTNKTRAFELLTLALTQPRFDEEPVSRMRKANQARIRSSLSKPNWIAARVLNDRAFEGHPYAQNSGGTLSTLENITPGDLRSFHKKLSRDRLVVAVSGDITAAELASALDHIFAGLPESSEIKTPAALTLQNQGKTYLFKKDIPQTIIEILQPSIDRKALEYSTAQVMNFVLGGSGFGSRLTKTIREERGLTYGIYSYLQDMNHIDLLAISSSTKNESAAEMLELIRAEWARMRDEPISEKELTNAKSYLIGSLPLSLTSTDKISGALLSLKLDDLPINYFDIREAEIQAVTAEEVQALAQDLLNPAHFTTVLVGQPEGLKNLEILSTIPNVE